MFSHTWLKKNIRSCKHWCIIARRSIIVNPSKQRHTHINSTFDSLHYIHTHFRIWCDDLHPTANSQDFLRFELALWVKCWVELSNWSMWKRKKCPKTQKYLTEISKSKTWKIQAINCEALSGYFCVCFLFMNFRLCLSKLNFWCCYLKQHHCRPTLVWYYAAVLVCNSTPVLLGLFSTCIFLYSE